MIFKPLAFKYLGDMPSPGGKFETFNIPTKLCITKPGSYYPIQARYWKIDELHANALFGVAFTQHSNIAIEVWVDRDDHDFVLMGYGLIEEAWLDEIIIDGCLIATIQTSPR